MRLLKHFEKTKECWFLIGISLIFFLLRFPSLFEPYWYGDEGIYEVIGTAINNGRFLYRDIWDNKPPLLYMIYAFFNGDQFLVRAFSLFFGIISLLFFYFLAKQLLQTSQKILFFVTSIFGFFFAIPLIEGNIANSENFMLFPILLGGLLAYKSTLQKHTRVFSAQLLFAGFMLGLAFLLKVVAVFDFAAFFVFLFFWHIAKTTSVKKEIKQIFQYLFNFGVGFAIPIVLTLIFFFANGIVSDFLNATLRQNVGYVGYGNSFIIPQGFLILKLLLLACFLGGLFLKRNLFSWKQIFILIWFSFSLFNAFFSGRPYTHYVLVLLPVLCLLCGIVLEEKQRMQKFFLGVLFIGTLLLVNHSFIFYQKNIAYYINFLSFIQKKESVTTYQAFFDKNTPHDYALAWFLNANMKKNSTVFIWGNNGQVYKLIDTLPVGRYIVAYHMTASPTSLAETSNALEKTKPTYIVVNNNLSFPFSLSNYQEKMQIYNITIYERTH